MLTEWINANYTTFIVLLVVVSIWALIWKGTAMWKASKRGSKFWFIVLLMFNTLGILPILYHLFTGKTKVKQQQNQAEPPGQ